MNRYLSNLFWIPKSEISDIELLKQRLTLVGKTFQGDPPLCFLYEEREDEIGVPRHFGLTYFGSFEDKTISKSVAWPELREGFSFRKGQEESVHTITEVFRKGQYGALLEAKTGSGKSVMSLIIAARLKVPVLVFTHKDDLASQWKSYAEEFFPGVKIGHVQQDTWDYKDKHLVTISAQTFYSRQDKIPADFWSHFGFTIWDEMHRYSARTFETALRHAPSKYRLGVSATFRRKDGLEGVWTHHIGKIEHVCTTPHLVGHYIQIPWKTDLSEKWLSHKGRVSYSKYVTAIAQNILYNKWLAEQCIEAAKASRKVLVVSERKEQLSDIRSRIFRSSPDCTVGLYVGSWEKAKYTEEQLQASAKCDIILGTYQKISEGTNIPDLDTIYLGTPRSDIEQSVGRIQRPHEGKQGILVVDPVFQTPLGRRSGAKRKKMYEKLGFKPQGDEE